MSTTATWRGDEGDLPRITANVLRWYRLRLPTAFHRQDGGPLEPARLAALVDWFADRSEFLIWKAEEEYRGARYSMGVWRLNMAAITEALPGAEREIKAEQRRAAFAAMGPVTGTDVDAALVHLQSGAALTEEPSGAALLFGDAHCPDAFRWRDRRNRLVSRWPRDCRECKQEFRPDFHGAKRCLACRARAHLERQARKGAQP